MTLSLIGRIEKLDGPDREVDVEIAYACGLASREHRLWNKTALVVYDPATNKAINSKFTASLDAVVALVERVRPGWPADLEVGVADPEGRFCGRLWVPGHEPRQFKAFAPTRPLALLLALLRSLGEEDE